MSKATVRAGTRCDHCGAMLNDDYVVHIGREGSVSTISYSGESCPLCRVQLEEETILARQRLEEQEYRERIRAQDRVIEHNKVRFVGAVVTDLGYSGETLSMHPIGIRLRTANGKEWDVEPSLDGRGLRFQESSHFLGVGSREEL